MLGNQTTVFKNDSHFGGDVVLRTEVRNNSDYMDITVIVIPNDIETFGGAMVWDLDETRYVAETHEELLEVLKGEEYQLRGGSVVEDIIGEPKETTMRDILTHDVKAMDDTLTDRQVRDVVRGLESYIGDYLAEQMLEQIANVKGDE